MRLMTITGRFEETLAQVAMDDNDTDSETLHKWLCENMVEVYSVKFESFVPKTVLDESVRVISSLEGIINGLKRDVDGLTRELREAAENTDSTRRYIESQRDSAHKSAATILQWFLTHNTDQQYAEFLRPLTEALTYRGKIAAIKFVRDKFGTDLLTAKRIVEAEAEAQEV